MATDVLNLVGAGGHGRVVRDAAVSAGADEDKLVVRDGRSGLRMNGRDVLTPEIDATLKGARFHVAVGSNALRARLHVDALAIGGIAATIVHPTAVVAGDACIDAGAFVAATAIVAPGAHVGVGTIVNHGAVVDHDVRVGNFCHVAPRAAIGGDVTMGDNVMIGAGAVILPGIVIASNVTIGAGAIVLRSIVEPGTWVGNPARKIAR